MAEKYVKAEKDYLAGMKYKELAEKYGVSLNTVKSWKQRYGWSRDKKAHPEEKSVHTKKKGRTQKKKDAPKYPDDGTRETLLNEDLTDEQRMFCIYYVRTFNATQSYRNAYGCSYDSAKAHGYELLRNVAVRAEIDRLKEIKRQQIVAEEADIVELQMRIAFGDIGDILQFRGGSVRLNASEEVDTQLIASVKEGKDGVSVKLKDSQRAIDWLSKYFLLHPDDKYRAEFDRKRAEVKDSGAEEILKNMQTITDILRRPAENRELTDFEADPGEQTGQEGGDPGEGAAE